MGNKEPPFDFSGLPLVGRAPVQDKLLSFLKAAQSGQGSTVILTGERGVGKSHLAGVIRGEAERKGVQTAAGQAYRAEARMPFSLFSDTFLPLLKDQSPEGLTVLSRGRVQDLSYLLPGLEIPRGPAAPMESETHSEFRTRVIWTFSEVLCEMARKTPFLVVLEDLQWADPSSLEIIHFLARHMKGSPTLFLMTRDLHPEEEYPELLEVERSLVGQGVAEALVLPPLTRDETGVLLEKAFHVDQQVAGEFTDALHQWTQGNPFFIQQTLEALVRSGRLYQKGDTWLGWTTRELVLPATVREAMAEPLEHLPRMAREVAELAAVLGTRAPFRLIRALGSMDESQLLEALDLLTGRGILREGLAEGGVVYDFPQHLVRETLLAEMGLARTRLLHARVARDLEEHFGEETPEQATRLAYHHLQSGGVEKNDRAPIHLALAGMDALRRFGNVEAAEYLAAALDQLPEGSQLPTPKGGPAVERRIILRDLATALSRLGKYQEAIPIWQEAIARAEEEGLQEEAAEYRRRVGIIRSSNAEPYEALKEFDTILALPDGAISPLLRAKTRLRKGVALEELGRPEEAAQELTAVLAEAEDLGDPAVLAQAHRALVILHIWTGWPDRVRAHADQALVLARESGARAVEFWTFWGLAVFEGLLGHTGPMGEWVEKAERVARELGSPVLRLRSSELAIEQAAATGEWDRGIAIGEQAISMARSLSQNTLLPRLLVWTSLIYLAWGEVELARPLIQEAWEVSGAGREDMLNIHGAIPAHIGLGNLALTEGDYDEAIRVGRAGLEMADGVGYRIWAIHRLLPLLAECHLWKGDLKEARTVGERLKKDSTPVGHQLGMAWAQTCEALITWLEREDPEEGARLMEEAARALEAIPMVFDAARVRRLKAGRMADAGDRLGALEELQRVHETFLRLGARIELEKTRGMFREQEARPPRRVSSGEGVLSPRELEIARLVEERMSNKAIARELGISPRTVSTHLSNIYQKVGVSSRMELADYMKLEKLAED